MIQGSCLCGVVRFEVRRFVGPFELCHCSRCRKASGSAFAPMIGVAVEDFEWVAGHDEVELFEAPVAEYPPGYRSSFCRHCGSPMPVFGPDDDWFEVAAGVLDDAPGLVPDRHIFVDFKAPWHEITDGIPQASKQELIRMRIAKMKHRKENE